MSRPLKILIITVAVLAFLAVTLFLTRFLNTEGVERDADLSLLRAEAAGNPSSLINQLRGCRANPTCIATQQYNASHLRRPGSVKILELTSHTAYTLSSATGLTRIAWTVIGRLPVVQCIKVHRTGNAISGLSVTLLGLSRPIPNMADC